MAPKRRLLEVLVRRFPRFSRDELYRRVMCSEVRVNGAVERNPAALITEEAEIVLDLDVELREPQDGSPRQERRRYVSRGGEKLAAALEGWGISPAGMVWLDAGASTGGFTDALLQGGAAAVHAVDVGYNQLDYRLRSDRRVFVHERTNIRDVSSLDPMPDAAVCDLSFRSLRGVLGHILELTTQGWGVALLKPQFEAAAEIRWGRRQDEGLDSGVVAPELRDDLIAGALADLAAEGIEVVRSMDSPITGKRGNREVLLHVYLRRSPGERGFPM
jgi:23S rRNA (cytidine1920-2'-O)/16S rRNA (cytidine1409-2'-O)-methyltransferase